jgi:hypothetical protein
MKLELFIFGITAFLIYNTYHDNKYSKMLIAYKKYYQIIFIGFVALSIYLLIKRNPLQSKNLLLYANNAVKYMPLDKSSVDLISPIFDLSSRGNRSFMEDYNNTINPYLNTNANTHLISQQQRNLLSGPKPTKRSVSETKKKYIASMQDWKCGQCSNKLTHTFEVDHKIRLEHGGSNDVTNLVALCRECHGQKTALENM